MATTIRSTALDFETIKNNLKNYLANKDEYRDYNFQASGLSNILDVLAYNTHINALIANFALNESYLNTSQLRSSVISLAEGIGYIPASETASIATVRIYLNTSVSPRRNIVTLPAFTKFTTDVDDITYTFQTIEAYQATDDGTGFYEFKTAGGSNRLSLYEGTQKTKTFLVGEYEDNPVYVIPDTKIDTTTIVVKVYESVSSTEPVYYSNIENSFSINSYSTVYFIKESPNGYFELSFGDGETFGVSPQAGNVIRVEYLATSGDLANGATVFEPENADFNGITELGVETATLNTTLFNRSVGGRAKESIDSIKLNAPFRYAAQNRMVTSQDYTSLILRTYSNYIKDIISWGGETALKPEFGAVYCSIVFYDDIEEETRKSIKRDIVSLAKQSAVTSFYLRFDDPITTYIELDTYFQFNPRLTDINVNAATNLVRDKVTEYFDLNTGVFGSAFRRSNLLAQVDDVSNAVLSSRANVRMQQRIVPTTPTVIAQIDANTNTTLSTDQYTTVIEYIRTNNYKAAATYLINNGLTDNNYTSLVTAFADVQNLNYQQIRFPVPIAAPDDNEYIITSSAFVYRGSICEIRNKLLSNTLQIIAQSGNRVLADNIGSYSTDTVSINYFTPTSIVGDVDYIKISAVPSNQSAIASERNDLFVYDPDRSLTQAVLVTAKK